MVEDILVLTKGNLKPVGEKCLDFADILNILSICEFGLFYDCTDVKDEEEDRVKFCGQFPAVWDLLRQSSFDL